MKHIVPYKTQRNALAALDNGGRFFNVLTRPSDGEVEASELAKVAGVYSNKQTMFLYLEMSLAKLADQAAAEVRSALSTALQDAFRAYRPTVYTSAQAVACGRPGKSAIITGVPHHVTNKVDFKGFILVPIFNGTTTTLIMVPMIDLYDVYEVHDEDSPAKFIIAHARRAGKLPKRPTRFGGVMKKVHVDKREKSKYTIYLDVAYYTRNC